MADFENRLWATASQLAQQAGMEFSVPCARNMRDCIQAGVRAMDRVGRKSEADLEEADASLSRLIGEMVRVTKELGTQARSGTRLALREGALVRAKQLGRLWPYC